MTMDSWYISDIMAHIGRYKWRMNMVGTSQVSWIEANTKATIDAM